MSVFICEKCGCLDNSACANNFWHARGNQAKKEKGEEITLDYKPEFSYFEDHLCCSNCSGNVEYSDSSGHLRDKRWRGDTDKLPHWTDYGKETLLDLESKNNGSCVNASKFFENLGGNNGELN